MRCRDLGACGATTWDVEGMVRSMMDALAHYGHISCHICSLTSMSVKSYCTVRSPRDRFTVLSAPPARCVIYLIQAYSRAVPHFLLNIIMRDSSHFRRLNKTVMSEQTPSPLTLKLDHTLITHMPVRGTQMPP